MAIDRTIPVGTRVTQKYDRRFIYGVVIETVGYQQPGTTVLWDHPHRTWGHPNVTHYTCGEIRACRPNEEVQFPEMERSGDGT